MDNYSVISLKPEFMRFFVSMRSTVTVFLLALFLSSCNRQQQSSRADDMEADAASYFAGWFNDQVQAGLHYSAPGNCFRQVKQTVPRKWWRYATESLYYRLPEIPDSGETDRWLDTAAVILPDDNVRSFLQMIRGNRLVASGNYNEALFSLQESYTLATQQNQLYRANDAKRYMARCLMLRGDYPQAISLLMEVLDFFSDKSDELHQVRKYETRFELARACLVSGDLNKALYWGKETMDYLQQSNNAGQKVKAAEQIAQIFLGLEKPDSALIYITEAEIIRQQRHVIADSASGHYLYGKTLTELKKYDEALPRLRLALAGNLEVKNRQKIADILSSLADCYLGMGQSDLALDYYSKALETTPDTSTMASVHYKLSDIYQQKNRFQVALYHMQAGARCFRIFFSSEKDRTIGRLESQAALDREASQVKFLTARQKSQQFKIALLVIVFLLGILALGLLLDRQRRKRIILEQEKELLKAHQLIQEQELRMANASLVQKTEEVTSLQNLLELKNRLISSLELQINATSSQESVVQPLRMLTELDWHEFRENFEKQFPNYIARLKNTFPKITSSEIRLFIFIRIGLENSQIASISGISQDSIYKSRFRLRQKLGLDPSDSLETFIGSF